MRVCGWGVGSQSEAALHVHWDQAEKWWVVGGRSQVSRVGMGGCGYMEWSGG